MLDFFTATTPKAAKPHRCHACRQTIERGTIYTAMSMKFAGEVSSIKQHTECRTAEIALAALHDLHGGEDWIHLNNLEEPEDLLWLRDNHPIVFERLKTTYANWLAADAARSDS